MQFLCCRDRFLHASGSSDFKFRYISFVVLAVLIIANRILADKARTFWSPFKTEELGRFEADIQRCKLEVDAEINCALHQTIYQEQQLQLSDRKAAARHWSILHKSNDEEKRWRIQTEKCRAST